MRAGFGINFEGGKADIHKNKSTWGTASPITNDGGLCYLEEYEKVEQYGLAANTQTIDTCHRRLGHLNNRAVWRLILKVTGIKIGDPYTRIGERNVDLHSLFLSQTSFASPICMLKLSPQEPKLFLYTYRP